MRVEIRSARPGDASAIAAVARASWHAAYDDLLGSAAVDDQVDEWYDPTALRQQVDEGPFVVADAGDETGGGTDEEAVTEAGVVGFAQGTVTDDGEAWLPRLYVHPDWWGEGVGTALLRRVAGALRERGHERLRLVVLTDNDVGRGFYEGHGFSVETRRRDTVGGVACEEVVLSAPLASVVDAENGGGAESQS